MGFQLMTSINWRSKIGLWRRHERKIEVMAISRELIRNRVGTRALLPALFIVISIVWIVIGLTQFGFWNQLRGGTPAFFPICVATVLLIASMFALVQSRKETEPVYGLLCFGFLLICFAVIALALVIGFLPSLLLFVMLWLRLVERAPWKGSLIVAICLAAVGYGLFQFWLKVPFPDGYIIDSFN
jgi:hypothetical protein